MYHFFAPGENGALGEMRLTGQDVNHISRVLRLKVGDEITVSDGQDRDNHCAITEIGPDFVRVKVLSQSSRETECPVHFTLFQGLPKGDKMELILEKAVELGAVRVVPVEMKRSVVKLEDKKKQQRRERLQKLAEAAAKQSGRRLIPEVGEIVPFRQAVAQASELDRILVPYESAENMTHTREVLSGLRAGQQVGIFIGPEGGFDPAEIEALQAAGAEILTLGPRILRTETAGLATLAMCMLWAEP